MTYKRHFEAVLPAVGALSSTTGIVEAITGLFVLALFALAGVVPASAADSVSLRLNWQMKGEFAPFIVGVEKGFFRDQGLDVKVQEGSSGTQALQAVAAGQDDFAYVPSVQLIEAVNHGLPVKAVATVGKIDSMGMVSLSDVPLKTPKDMEGRTVEITATATFSQIWSAFARKNGIDESKVTIVRVAPGARFNLLLTRKVDVLADIFMTNEYPVLQKQVGQQPLNAMVVGDWGFRLIGYILATQQKTIDDKPDLVKRFNIAAARAFRFTVEHPDEAAQIASAAYPKVLFADTTLGQVKELVSFLGRGEPKRLFAGSDEGWSNTLEILAPPAAGTAAVKPVSAYYTNAFVPADE
jgi:ABC-type nitrate/sulfonate/bicarbonate transport system substrate-binding protein